MSILDKLFGRKGPIKKAESLSKAPIKKANTPSNDPIKKAESLYQEGLNAVRAERFKDAVSLLEVAARLNPQSAPIHNILAFSYFRIGAENMGDEETINSLASKGADTWWRAITLHRQHGGLEPKQLTTAMEFVARVDGAKMRQANVPPEEERKKIFLEWKVRRESGFDFNAATGDMLKGRDLLEMTQAFSRHSGNAESIAIEYVTKTFGLNERQLRAIVMEGANKKWR